MVGIPTYLVPFSNLRSFASPNLLLGVPRIWTWRLLLLPTYGPWPQKLESHPYYSTKTLTTFITLVLKWRWCPYLVVTTPLFRNDFITTVRILHLSYLVTGKKEGVWKSQEITVSVISLVHYFLFTSNVFFSQSRDCSVSLYVLGRELRRYFIEVLIVRG